MADADNFNQSNKSDVWLHFWKSLVDKAQHGSCNICQKRFKCLYGSTSALRSHLKSAHVTTHKQLVDGECARKQLKKVSKLETLVIGISLLVLSVVITLTLRLTVP